MIKNKLKNDQGIGAIEYVVIFILISIFLVFILMVTGTSIKDVVCPVARLIVSDACVPPPTPSVSPKNMNITTMPPKPKLTREEIREQVAELTDKLTEDMHIRLNRHEEIRNNYYIIMNEMQDSDNEIIRAEGLAISYMNAGEYNKANVQWKKVEEEQKNLKLLDAQRTDILNSWNSTIASSKALIREDLQDIFITSGNKNSVRQKSLHEATEESGYDDPEKNPIRVDEDQYKQYQSDENLTDEQQAWKNFSMTKNQ